MDGRRVGVLGGGQLGRMMAEAGHRLGIQLNILDPGTCVLGGEVGCVLEGWVDVYEGLHMSRMQTCSAACAHAGLALSACVSRRTRRGPLST